MPNPNHNNLNDFTMSISRGPLTFFRTPVIEQLQSVVLTMSISQTLLYLWGYLALTISAIEAITRTHRGGVCCEARPGR